MDPFENLEGFNFSEELKERLQNPDYLRKELNEGKSFQEILQLSDEVMEQFYRTAHDLFEQQAYKEASDAFFFLTNLNPYNSTYWLGLGMSEQLNNGYEAGLVAYGMCSLLDSSNPLPYYHSGTCYKAMKDPSNAIASFDLAIEAAGDDPNQASLKKHAQEAKNTIKK